MKNIELKKLKVSFKDGDKLPPVIGWDVGILQGTFLRIMTKDGNRWFPKREIALIDVFRSDQEREGGDDGDKSGQTD